MTDRLTPLKTPSSPSAESPTSPLGGPAIPPALHSPLTPAPQADPTRDSSDFGIEEQSIIEEVSNTPPTVNTATRPAIAQDNVTSPVDSSIAALRAMFPDYDVVVLESVLQSTRGNQDAAVEILLGMSDPEYKSEIVAEERLSQIRAKTQTELDEEFARRLQLEEELRQQRAFRRRSTQYQVYNGPRSQPTTGSSTVTPGDNTVTDGLSRVAEVGKKTFETIFTKVKSAIAEFDQGRPTGSGGSPWAGGYATYHGVAQTRPTPESPRNNPDPAFDPYAPEHDAPYQTVSPAAARILGPPQGYDVEDNESRPLSGAAARILGPPGGYNTAEPEPAISSVTPPPRTSSPAASSTAPPPAVIDKGKLGLLPKKPVSLVRDPPQHSSQSIDSDDELEYAENPFEEHRDRKK